MFPYKRPLIVTAELNKNRIVNMQMMVEGLILLQICCCVLSAINKSITYLLTYSSRDMRNDRNWYKPIVKAIRLR